MCLETATVYLGVSHCLNMEKRHTTKKIQQDQLYYDVLEMIQSNKLRDKDDDLIYPIRLCKLPARDQKVIKKKLRHYSIKVFFDDETKRLFV